MDFGLSEEQRLLQETMRGFATAECPAARLRELFEAGAGHDPALWKGLAEIGVAGLALPEAHGGSGLELLELALVAEVLGASALPVPFLGHALAGLAIALGRQRGAARGAGCLRLATGDVLATVAFGEPDERWQPEQWQARARARAAFRTQVVRARWRCRGSLRRGSARRRARARSARRGAVCIARRRDARRSHARRSPSSSSTARPADGLPDGARAAARVRDAALVLLAADAFGAAWRMMRLTADYARTREQFGTPIAQFQAVKHQLANMVDRGRARARAALVRRARVSTTCPTSAARGGDRQGAHHRARDRGRARRGRAARRDRLHLGVRRPDLVQARDVRPRACSARPKLHRERSAALGGLVGMDLRYGEKYEAFRAELREFLRGWPLRGAEARLPPREQRARCSASAASSAATSTATFPPSTAARGASPTW